MQERRWCAGRASQTEGGDMGNGRGQEIMQEEGDGRKGGRGLSCGPLEWKPWALWYS